MEIVYETERLLLVTPTKRYLDSILSYYERNRDFLEPWETERSPDFYTKQYHKSWIKDKQKEIRKMTGVCFLIVAKDNTEKVIGMVELSGLLYGNFCSCYLGYRLDKDERNKGYMTEAVCEVINVAFDDLYMHRIEASIIPTNDASRAVLKKCGFKYVGLSTAYLKIYGKWQPHEIYEYIVEDDRTEENK